MMPLSLKKLSYGSISTPYSGNERDGDPVAASRRCDWLLQPGNSSKRQRRTLVFTLALSTTLLWAMLLLPSSSTSSQNQKVSLLLSPSFLVADSSHHSHSSHQDDGDDDTEVRYYPKQSVDHFSSRYGHSWSQRYYQSTRHWKGQQGPILLIVGGEDPLEGLLYPVIYQDLAQELGAVTYAVEHRFFGQSQPIHIDYYDNDRTTTKVTRHARREQNRRLAHLLTPAQAVADLVQFVEWRRQQLNCSNCSVLTVGASYPGLLSFLARSLYPDTIQAAYASSAPLALYAHTGADARAYYQHVSEVADRVVPGCVAAVQQTLKRTIGTTDESTTMDQAVTQLGVCRHSVPNYIHDFSVLAREVNFVVATRFADANMEYYPPGPDTDLERSCRIFTASDDDDWAKLARFLALPANANCFDMAGETPPGGTISAADWSGVGGGPAGYAWDFLSCVLQPRTSFTGIALDRKWTQEWLKRHCQVRFAYTPQYDALDEKFGLGAFLQNPAASNVSRILFTNGGVDGWSVESVLQQPKGNNDLVVMNFPNGAHHSDLAHEGANAADTSDIQEGVMAIRHLLIRWLGSPGKEDTSF